jgi:HEAT repeat protein
MLGQASLANGETPLTEQQVRELLPTGVDMLDSTDAGNYQRLVDAGPRAHKALAELLNETDDPVLIGRIFSVFAESSGDKTVALSAVTNVLGRYKGHDTPEARKVRIYAAQTLGKIGSAAEMPVLQDMLQDSDERVRVNVIRALSKSDDAERLKILEKFVESRSESSSAEALGRDRSVQEAREAVGRMRKQLCTDESQKVTE